MPKRDVEVTISVPEIERHELVVHVLGTTPLILNRMSQKSMVSLLIPPRKKNAAEKAATLKHVPLDEYRASPYTLPDDDAPTLLALLATSFKGAMMTAALDLPGTKKAQIGRLVRVDSEYGRGDYIPVYGKPELSMMVVRMADQNKTPDVRTRAILPRWACSFKISFQAPLLNGKAVATLLKAGGQTVGVGDFRTEKGKGNYGSFRIVDATDKEYLAVCGEDRLTQQTAIAVPEFYDIESRDLYALWEAEVDRRGQSPAGDEPDESDELDESEEEA